MKSLAMLAAAATLGFGSMAMADVEGSLYMDIDVSGWQSGDFVDVDLGGGFKVEITGIGWNVGITPFGELAWYSDSQFSFGEPNAGAQIFVTPAAGNNNGPGEPLYFSSDGILKLADFGLPPIQLNGGVLQVSYSDGGWGSSIKEDSFFTVQYSIIPAPGAMALIGLAGLVSRRRRA